MYNDEFENYSILDEYVYDDKDLLYEDDEIFTEMSTVGTQDRPSLRIQVNPDPGRIGNPYVKVFDNPSPKKGETQVVRLRFKDNQMEYHNDSYLDWNPGTKDWKNIITFFKEDHDDFPQYTNWQMACYLWNYEYRFFSNKEREKYFDGGFEKSLRNHPSYVSYNQKMPEDGRWIYNPPKSKNKRKKLSPFYRD